MTALTYTDIFKKNLSLYVKSLNLKKISKLFFHSLVFRCLLYLIALFIPNYYTIIYSAIFTYLLLVKPYANSKGIIKVFFSDIIFMFFTISTIFVM